MSNYLCPDCGHHYNAHACGDDPIEVTCRKCNCTRTFGYRNWGGVKHPTRQVTEVEA